MTQRFWQVCLHPRRTHSLGSCLVLPWSGGDFFLKKRGVTMVYFLVLSVGQILVWVFYSTCVCRMVVKWKLFFALSAGEFLLPLYWKRHWHHFILTIIVTQIKVLAHIFATAVSAVISFTQLEKPKLCRPVMLIIVVTCQEVLSAHAHISCWVWIWIHSVWIRYNASSTSLSMGSWWFPLHKADHHLPKRIGNDSFEHF